MVALNLFIVLLLLFVISCASKQDKNIAECDKGKTSLDGVCIREDIVDYVGCVRAQGVKIDSVNSKSLSVEMSYFAISARGVEDVSKQLEKKYEASDKAILAIIEQCNKIAGVHEHAFSEQNITTYTRGNGKEYHNLSMDDKLVFILTRNKTYYGEINGGGDKLVEVKFREYNDISKTFKGSVGYMGRNSFSVKSFSGSILRDSLIFLEDGWIKNGGAWFGMEYKLKLNDSNTEMVGKYKHKNGSDKIYLVIKP